MTTAEKKHLGRHSKIKAQNKKKLKFKFFALLKKVKGKHQPTDTAHSCAAPWNQI